MQDHSSFYQLIGTLGLYILIGQTLRMSKMTLLPYDPVSTANQLGWNDAKCVLELKGEKSNHPIMIKIGSTNGGQFEMILLMKK